MCLVFGNATLEISVGPTSHLTFNLVPSVPPKGQTVPFEISPTVVPHSPFTVEPMAPMYPSFPVTYNPILSGKCVVNFSAISHILDRTASDCSAPLAELVGNVICCPQVRSLLHIFQGNYSGDSVSLSLKEPEANDCFADIMTILASRGANNTIPAICSVKSSNLTGGSCPVKDLTTFEKIVNTSKLLDACSTVDPLKECCRPVCQPAIVEAAVHLSSSSSSLLANANVLGQTSDVLNDCKGVTYAWLSRTLSIDAANIAFRILFGCKVNKVCPLEFKEPTSVVHACKNRSFADGSCCSSLNTYVASLQKQMLITNRQALNCATFFGSQLQKAGVTTNVYEHCGIDLKDFSLQAFGQQGCLLRSSPTDVIFDNSTGFSFTCDLSDNIAAPWPSSSSLSSLSLCAESSLAALPTTDTSGSLVRYQAGIACLVLVAVLLIVVLVT